MRPMLLDFFCIPNVPQFTITTAASDFVPLGLILKSKPKKNGPKQNQAKTCCLFFSFCNYASCRPKLPHLFYFDFKPEKMPQTQSSTFFCFFTFSCFSQKSASLVPMDLSILAQTVLPQQKPRSIRNVLFYARKPYIFTSLGEFVLAQTVLPRKSRGALETYCFIEETIHFYFPRGGSF